MTGLARTKYLKFLFIFGVLYAVLVIAKLLYDGTIPTSTQDMLIVGMAIVSLLYHAVVFKLITAKYGRHFGYLISIVCTGSLISLVTFATGDVTSLNNLAMLVVIFFATVLGPSIATALAWMQIIGLVALASGGSGDSDVLLLISWSGLFCVAALAGWILLSRPGRAQEQESIDHLRKTLVEERLRSEGLISALDDGIVIVGKDGVIRHANKRFLQMIAMKPEDMVNKTYTDVVSSHVKIVSSSSSNPLISHNMADVFQTGNPVTIDTETIENLDDGSRLDVSISILPLKNEDDQINVVMLIARDITKIMDVQRMKDEFITLASHELRTPATVISGYADLLLNPMFGELSEKQRHYATRTKESTQHLVDLVNDMLLMSQLESGRYANQPEKIDSNTIITEAIRTKQAQIDARQLSINYDHESIAVNVDKARLLHVLDQLISNAIIFSPNNGRIVIKTGVQSGVLAVTVSDQGQGIPDEKRKVIFDKFTKLDDSGEISGTGLGLAICKRIVQDWGGTIGVSAQTEGGSVFAFTIPVRSEKPTPDTPTDTQKGK